MTSQSDLFVPAPVSGDRGSIASLHRSNGGVPKLIVHSAYVGAGGMEGDRQRNLKHHGGPERALCLYSFELMEALRMEGHPVGPGTMGENVLLRGLDWDGMVPGVRLRLGPVEVHLTGYASPCRNIAGSFRDGRFERVSPKTHPGWSRIYARLTRIGELAAGNAILRL